MASAPPGDPPRYHRYINKYSLRFPLMFSSAIGLIWGIARGVTELKYLNDLGESSKEKLFDILLGALYFATAGVSLYLLVVSALQNIRLAKFTNIMAPLGVVLAIGVSVLAVVAHFVTKSDLLKQCVANVQGAYENDGYGNTRLVDSAEATRLCNSDFSHDSWVVIGWLIFVVVLSVIFAGIAMSYYRQLLNPPAPVQQSYPLQPQGPPAGHWGGPPPTQQQSWMVPPYPGPPPPGSIAQPYEKEEYHPSADWAQQGETPHELSYAPPAGPPPGTGAGSRSGFGTDRAEEEAWERARSQGVTAHLTGHAPPPQTEREEGRGYLVGNEEEEEAWERAKSQGVTAHLTGQRRNDNAV